MGLSFTKVIDTYEEMPPIWTAPLNRPDASKPLMSSNEAARFIARQEKDTLRSQFNEARAYGYFLYTRTKPLDQAPARELYYPRHVTANGYSGILPKGRGEDCAGKSGASPKQLKVTRQGDDFKRNYGAGLRLALTL